MTQNLKQDKKKHSSLNLLENSLFKSDVFNLSNIEPKTSPKLMENKDNMVFMNLDRTRNYNEGDHKIVGGPVEYGSYGYRNDKLTKEADKVAEEGYKNISAILKR